jgi:hypothetical protein
VEAFLHGAGTPTSATRSLLRVSPGSAVALPVRVYRTMCEAVRLPRKEDRPGRVPVANQPLATNRRARDETARVMREYLEHPCAVPGCPCMTHRLGLPTLAELVAAGYFAAHCGKRDRQGFVNPMGGASL